MITTKNKKPNHLISRQLGYLVRPVAFRPCLAAGLALSYLNLYLFNYMIFEEGRSREQRGAFVVNG